MNFSGFLVTAIFTAGEGARKDFTKSLANIGGKGLERPNLRRSRTYMRLYTTFPWRGRKDSHLHLQVRCGIPDGLKLTYSPILTSTGRLRKDINPFTFTICRVFLPYDSIRLQTDFYVVAGIYPQTIVF